MPQRLSRLGADLVGIGAPALGSAMETAKAVENQLSAVVEELKIAMFVREAMISQRFGEAVLRNVADGEPA